MDKLEEALKLAQNQCKIEVVHFGENITPEDKILRSILKNDYEPKAILKNLFDNDEDLKKICFSYVVHPNGCFPIDQEQLIEALLFTSVVKGYEKTLQFLRKIIDERTIDIAYVAVIAGLELEKEFYFKHSKFLSFNELPDSPYKEIYSSLLDKEHGWGLESSLPSPSSALLSLTNYGKVIPTDTVEHSGMRVPVAPKNIDNQIPRSLAQEEHNEIILSLALTDGTPVHIGGWFYVEDGILLKSLSGVYNFSLHNLDKPRSESKITQTDIENIVLPFLELDKSIKDKLLIPLTRLNQAKRPRLQVDKAIDIGIALEALLLNDRSHKEQIAYTFRLRGAWFLGTDSQSRKILIQVFLAIYNYRSQAVHSGKLDNKVKISSNDTSYFINTNDFLDIGIDICKLVIEQIVINKCFPNWDELVLGFPSSIEVQIKVEKLLKKLTKG